MFRSFSKVLLAALLIVPAVVLAQQTGTVAGTVVDAETGESLPGANVLIEETTLGAAADIDGNYRIIGVPIGTYDITASFVGYEPVTQTGVEVSASFTRNVEFELSTGAELEEVEVVYERPLIERSAVGAPRTVSGDDIQNLPVRGAENVASLQSGVVEGQAGGLNIRGGRQEEVAYYVDGVRVRSGSGGGRFGTAGVGSGNVAANNAAIAEQEMLIGTVPARYGDVQSGVISISTRSGRSRFFGSLEGYTSEALDAYGWNLASVSLGGPIVPGTAGFFISGEGSWQADASPYGKPFLELSDEQFDFVQTHPQTLRIETAAGDEHLIPVPMQAFDGRDLRENGQPANIMLSEMWEQMEAEGLIPEGLTMEDVLAGNVSLLNTPETITEADGFSEVRGKDDPSTDYSLNGNLTFDILPTLNLRLGGAYQMQDDRSFSFARSFYNRNYGRQEREYFRLFGTVRHRISDNAFYQITGDYQNDKFWQYPEGSSKNMRSIFNFGNLGRDYYDTAVRYLDSPAAVEDDEEHVVDLAFPRRNTQNGFLSVGSVSPNLFPLPGFRSITAFQRRKGESFGVSAQATVQLGAHQLEFGGEYEQQTNRQWQMTAADAFEVAQFRNEYDSYENLPFDEVFEDRTTGNNSRYFGYDFRGLNEVNNQNLQEYYHGDGSNRNVAPWRPYYYGGYVTDRVEFNDLVLDVGFRLDAFNTNTTVLKDLWATEPIFRASDARSSGATVPQGINDEWGVFYAGGVAGNQNIVGYRDLDGNVYNAGGEQISLQDMRALGGRHVVDEEADILEIFEDSETQFTFMPRLGVSFPVTDRALFFASYNVTSQRPTEAAFEPFYQYTNAAGSWRIANSTLEPETTTQYELGFRQRLGERAAFTISGFYKSQTNKIALRNLDLANVSFGTYLNRDFTTSQGAEIGFQLRRTGPLAIDVNYTLAFAKGSGSDANTTNVIAWRGNTFPNFVAPADFDQRHTANIAVDYRYGAGEGPVIAGARPFQNLGLNVLATFGSGQRYTPLQNCRGFEVTATFTCNTRGNINSATLPATYQIDLKLDRTFDLGFSESSLKVYLWITNLLNTRNVLAVYRETGRPDFQDFYAGRLGQSRLEDILVPESRLFNYNAWVSGPVNNGGNQSSQGAFYGPPRQIRLGVLFNF